MILVDDATYRWRKRNWCHMVSTESEEELHTFAVRLGLKRSWFQMNHPINGMAHYDLTDTKRLKALQLGAQPVTGRILFIHACYRPGARQKRTAELKLKYPLSTKQEPVDGDE